VALALSSARAPASGVATTREDGVQGGSMRANGEAPDVSRLDVSRAGESTDIGSAQIKTGVGSGHAVLDLGEARDAADSIATGWHALAAAGLDGVGGHATAVLGAGVALQSRVSAWRALVWYGGRSIEREAEGVESSETRSDFAAATLDYCRGLDGMGWIGLCGGVELALARRWRAEQYENTPRREREVLYPGASAALGAVFAYPGAGLEPRVDISARWPVVGGPAEERGLGIRATGGVALSFR
jgi:hypothetical protein